MLAVYASSTQLDYVWSTPSIEVSSRVRLKTELYAQMIAITEELARETKTVPERIAGLGNKLANQLLPGQIGEALVHFSESSVATSNAGKAQRVSTPPLWIVSNEGVIPWELIRPAGVPLALGQIFRLTRWIFDLPCPSSFSLDPFVLCVAGSQKTEKYFAREVKAVRMVAKKMGWDFTSVGPQTAKILARFEDETPAALHVVAHAGRDGKSPLLSHLKLANEQKLTLADLSGIDLRPRSPFVFLNACESAAPSLGFSGAESFATQFVEQGAAAFVGTYWKVDDETAPDVAEEIYGALSEGESLGEALRLARTKVRDSSTNDASPWGYTAYGHPDASLDSQREPVPAVRWPGRFLEVSRKEYVEGLSVPGTLLRADHGIVPFHLRDRELDDLLGWALDERELGIRLYTGPGGQGKTRLALRLCDVLRDEGWRTGFVRLKADKAAEEALEEIFAGGGPVLAVIDYAETRRRLLVPLAELIFERRQDGPFRIILLSRRREEWWEQLKREAEPVGSFFSGKATRHFALQPLATTVDQRMDTFHKAANAFAQQLGQQNPEGPAHDLEERYFDPVLMIHMHALNRVEGVNLEGEDGVLDTTLNREKRFWSRGLEALGLSTDIYLPGLSRTMCAITLCGGTEDRESTLEIMRKLSRLADQPRAILEVLASLLRRTYPGERWVMPILPDILGEHLIERELTEDPQEVFNLVLGPQQQTANPL